ncbi:MAG: hypothetical protein NT124_02985 [Candidatus Dependentiae bacterium]|nr:hypothetical protein [Candidatus Dependentiae bacterium]
MIIRQNKQSKTVLSSGFILVACCALLAPAIKLSFIVGSFFTFFSIKNCIVPLSGAFGGILGSFILCLFRLVIGASGTGICSLKIVALYVPGLFGSLYWASKSAIIRVLLPATCMALFLIHPIGAAAYAYSFFWLIPIALYFIPNKTIFFESLGSTYTVHAVGSVIWLYTVGMTPTAWLGLIPLVFIERTLFAIGMTATHSIVSRIATMSTSKIHHVLVTRNIPSCN